MPCRKVPGIFFMAAFPLLLFLMASGAAALGISDGTFSPQTGVERGKAYSQGVLLTNSPNRDNHFVVTVGGDVGSWVTSISPSDFNLTANQQQLITLAINVPANATFGSHAGTVTATATYPAGDAGIIEATKGNLYATVMGSVVCGDGVCDSGESSSNCCSDCPSTAGGGGVSYGPWYCSGSNAKARVVSNSSYVCNSQTKAYEYVTTNTTEASQCESNTVCSGGSCIVNQTAPLCGNNVCESGESSSNCCTDCPSQTGGVGVAYGSWYCKDSATKARLLTTVTSVCDNQTKTYKTVTTNSTEAQACSSGQTCSNGECLTAPANATRVNATRSEFYWNIDWIDLNAATSAREDSLSVSPGQAISGKFAYTIWNGPVCRGGCDCIDEIVLGLEGEPKYCLYAGIPWCYPGNSGEAKFSFAAPEKAGTYSLYYAASQSYTCEDAYSTYKTSTGRKPAGKLVVSGASAACTDSDGGNDIYAAGYVTYNVVAYKDYCAQPVKRADGTVALDPVSSCSGSECSVFEYWCGGTQGVESQSYSCPQGCADGACLYANATQNCVRAKPTIKVTPESQIGVAGETSKYIVEAFNNDNHLCAPSDISLTFPNHDAESKGAYAIRSLNDFPGGIIPPTKPGASYKLTMLADVLPNTPKGTYYITLVAEHQGASRYTDAAYSTAVQPSIVVSDRALELSIATDKSSYTQGEQVRISSKTHVSGNLVDAYVKGLVVRPDGGSDELVFAGETCKQPICKPGAPCIQVACQIQTGYLNAFYNAGMEGAYYIKASASYGNSLAESSAKFAVGVRKKARLYAWLENYNYNSGDTVKIFAKLTDERGEPVLGADVSARIHWAGEIRPVYRQALVGIETAAARKLEGPVRATVELQIQKTPVQRVPEEQPTAVAQASGGGSPVATAQPAVPTGYAVASISTAVEKQVAVPEAAGITYEEEMRIKASKQTTASSPAVAQPAVRPDIMPLPPKPDYGYVKLSFNPSSNYYEGTYAIPSDARSGEYKVAVAAEFGNQRLSESTAFSVGGEDFFSFESRARQSASEGRYGDCKDYYLKAAQELSAKDQHRMFLDIEKAGICARLGNLPDSFYSDVGRIVEKASGEGDEKYVLLGVASQYYELGGDYARSRELLEKAASGLEQVRGGLSEEYSLLANAVLAKYYSLLGKGSAGDYYKNAAELFAGRQGSGSDTFLLGLFSARLYAKAGDLESAKKQYLAAASKLSERSSSGGSDALIMNFIAADAYEKAGNADKANELYGKTIEMGGQQRYSSSDVFFVYSAIGRSYERLGEKDKAKEQYQKGLDNLLSKDDSDSAYFAAGLAGYLGDYGKSKELCRKQFERSLSEESNIGKLTFMNAYCYSVLGDSVRAKKGCDLNSVSPQGETMLLEYILEPFPPPVSYCSQSAAIAPPKESCGNGVIDAGETSENCCADTGCAFGDTCSKALNKCVKPVKEIPQESILEVLLKLEDARIKLDTLEGKALAISKYYSGKDQPKSDAWAKAANVFEDAKSKIDNIKKDLKDNRENITEDTLEGIRQKLEGVRGSLKDAIDAILEAV